MKYVALSLVAASLLLVSNASQACMGFRRSSGSPYPFPKDEVALIVWDSKNGTQHFIRQARFPGAGHDFAFVVPVPSTPELDEAPAELFGWLWNNIYRPGEGEIDGVRSSRGLGGGGKGSAPVEVLKQQKVAGMDASVVRSSSPDSLQAWLSENGYDVPIEAGPWIKHYVDQGWQFVAFKIRSSARKEGPSDPATGGTIASPLVRISFKTPRPFYPYRESAMRKKIPKRELSLFVIAPTEVIGSYESIKPWGTKHDVSVPLRLSSNTGAEVQKLDWSARKADGRKGEAKKSEPMTLNRYMKKLLGRDPAAEHLMVSHFRDQEELRTYDEDLYFDPRVLK